jgi:DNA repair protein RadC
MIVLRDLHLPVTRPGDAFKPLQQWFLHKDPIERDKEHALVMMLNIRNQVTAVDLVGIGILNANLLHPREVYRRAISLGAAQIILAHNHPSEDCTPSDEDIEVTKRLSEAGRIIGIELVDHIVFARHGFYSFKDHGLY